MLDAENDVGSRSDGVAMRAQMAGEAAIRLYRRANWSRSCERGGYRPIWLTDTDESLAE